MTGDVEALYAPAAMKLDSLLSANKKQILDLWFDRLLASYAPDTAKFFKRHGNTFDNPVGTTLHEGLGNVLQGMIEGRDSSDLASALLPMIKIRAIHDLAPSEAMRFVFELKSVVREIEERADASALGTLDAMVDEMALQAFDVYNACREQVFEIRMDEIKRSTAGLLRVMNRKGVLEDPDAPLDTAECGVCAARLERGEDS